MTSPANPFDQQQALAGVKHIILIASGKGGVGKSTTATNIALALGQKFKVGLLDADIYGPSIPRMLGALHQKPMVSSNQKIEPIIRYNVKSMSMGYLVEENAAIVWRGPMLFKALDQFFKDINWGELDYLVIDLPPGTGDVQLTIAQKVKVSGAIMVSTPQNISLIDVKRAVDMFQRVQIKILGVIENMSSMLNPANGELISLFPRGDMDQFMSEKNIPKLGEIHFHPHVALASEAGVPIVESHPQSLESQVYINIAKNISELLPI